MRKADDLKVILYRESDIDNPMVKKFLSLDVPVMRTYLDEIDLSNAVAACRREGFSSKEVLLLKEFKGRFFQKCPGSHGMICCNYYVINTCFNCLYNCSYCFLESYLNAYGIMQFVNIASVLDEIGDFHAASDPGLIYRIGSGEFTDSLMFDTITGIATLLIEKISKMKNIMLELKTKSSNVDHLLGLKNKGNTVIAWSMNTERNIKKYEHESASFEDRLASAKRAYDSGYFIAFHFDPIIIYNGWRDDYSKCIRSIFETIDSKRIVWISLGCFRYSPQYKDFSITRNADDDLTLEEMFQGPDGKYRYFKGIRKDIYSAMLSEIRSCSDSTFVYMCMETSYMWRDVFHEEYNTSEMLESAISKKMKNILSQQF
jgi:spore photoproduct lyase